MKRFLPLMFAILMVSSLIGCQSSEIVMAENHGYKITAIEKDGSMLLRSVNKKTGQKQDLLKTDPDSRMFASLDYENISQEHKDSLLSIDKVTILWSQGDTLYLALEDCADASNQNTHTFIFNDKSDSLIHLPTNAGLMGLTTEEGYLVMQSYEYYDQGGRFNVIDVYDYRGVNISSLLLTTQISDRNFALGDKNK
jgi:hypothetical protein